MNVSSPKVNPSWFITAVCRTSLALRPQSPSVYLASVLVTYLCVDFDLVPLEGAFLVVFVVKNPAANAWAGKFPCRRAGQPTSVFLPGESHRQRNLAGYSP